MTSPDETEALALKLAALERDCPDCQGELMVDSGLCIRCHGTGRVALFKDVRIPCRKQHWKPYFGDPPLPLAIGQESATHEEVGCPRWTPTLDLERWSWAFAKVGLEVTRSWCPSDTGPFTCATVRQVPLSDPDMSALARKAEDLLEALATEVSHA